MATVVIKCPRTGNFVSTGTELEPQQFQQLGPKFFRIRCSDCGSEHLWSRGTARLAEVPNPAAATTTEQVELFEQVNSLSASPPLRKLPVRASPQGHISEIIERLLENDAGTQSTATERKD